jgi:hypothetical protein
MGGLSGAECCRTWTFACTLVPAVLSAKSKTQVLHRNAG